MNPVKDLHRMSKQFNLWAFNLKFCMKNINNIKSLHGVQAMTNANICITTNNIMYQVHQDLAKNSEKLRVNSKLIFNKAIHEYITQHLHSLIVLACEWKRGSNFLSLPNHPFSYKT